MVNKQCYQVEERIEKDQIVLDGAGKFPKAVIILERGRRLLYRLTKTRNGKFQLNK